MRVVLAWCPRAHGRAGLHTVRWVGLLPPCIERCPDSLLTPHKYAWPNLIARYFKAQAFTFVRIAALLCTSRLLAAVPGVACGERRANGGDGYLYRGETVALIAVDVHTCRAADSNSSRFFFCGWGLVLSLGFFCSRLAVLLWVAMLPTKPPCLPVAVGLRPLSREPRGMA